MKNLILAAALSMGTLVAFAQDTDDADKKQKTATEVTASTQDGFNQIATNEVPKAISETMVKEMPTVTISKVYINDKGQYKLEVTQEDGTVSELYADAKGNWIDM